MANPLGISTGQGKGLAQVFGDTYNDYYKEKADEGAKKKAELEAAMAKSSAGVWDRDLGLFKPMREDLRKYVQDNARDIIDGKFDANVGWQAKQDELLQFINSSKAAKTFYENTLKLYNNNPEKYSDLSKEDILKYAATPGDFSSNIILEGKFDSQASKKAMLDALSKVQYNTQGIKEVELPSGKKYAVETSNQRKEAAKDILDSQRDFDLKNFPRQAKDFWTQQEYDNQLAALERSLGSKTVFKQESDCFTAYDRNLGKNLKLAKNLKRDIWLTQNYVGEESDLALQKLVEGDKNIISARHTMSDPALKSKYKGAGGVVISRRRGNDVIEEFVASKDYNTFLKGMLSSGLYPSSMRDYLDQVEDYSPTKEELEIAGKAPSKPEATQQVSDLSNLVANMFGGGTADQYKAHISSLGLSDDLSGRLLAKVGANKSMTPEMVLDVISPEIKASSVEVDLSDRGTGKGEFGGKYESVEFSDKGKTVTINFSKDGKSNSVEFDTTNPNEKDALQNVVKEILTGKADYGNNNVPSSGKTAAQIAAELAKKIKK